MVDPKESSISRIKILIRESDIAGSIADDRIDSAFDKFSLVLYISKELASTRSGQLMFVSCVNLIGRFCQNMFFEEHLQRIALKISLPFGGKDNLLDTCFEVAKLVHSTPNPRIFTDNTDCTTSLSIGPGGEISISCNGWIVHLNCENTESLWSPHFNPIGALAASCLGAVEVFKKLLISIGIHDPRLVDRTMNLSFSTLTYSVNEIHPLNPSFPEAVSLGKVLFAGCGAVNNGTFYALYQVKDVCRGSGVALDDQKITASNAERYVLTTHSNVGVHKAELVELAFANSSFPIKSLPISIETLTSEGISEYDIVVSGLDNRNNNAGRLHLQKLLPKRIIHAATQMYDVSIANLNFLDGACLGCLFSPRQAQVKLVDDILCGGVVLQLRENEKVAASISFVSALSGVLAASELLKYSHNELRKYSLRNYFSIRTTSPRFAETFFRRKDGNCIAMCDEPFRQNAFSKKYELVL